MECPAPIHRVLNESQSMTYPRALYPSALRRAVLRLSPWRAPLSACALIRHDEKPYATIPPEQIRIADDIHLAGDGWPAARWWSAYGDPQLDSLIDRALAACADTS